jgi:2-polyprenyl-6-methoxyphenol hydroxylase-like FAD-dependent oxidoreductase
MKVDVLVAGAGPVGLAMAVELARYGLSVRIVDKAAERTDKSKALVLWSRTLELLDRAGCSQALVDAGGKVLGVNIVEGSTQIAHLVLDRVVTPHAYALMLPQSETERLLDKHLNANGIQVERSVELTQFAVSADQVLCTLRHADGREEQLEASWLIGCDGAHSTVRHQLGFEFIGDTLPSNWILADLHLSGLPWKGEIDIAWHSDGILAIFPISQDRYRVIADVGDAGDATPEPTLQEVQEILDQRGPGGIQASAPVWLASFRINERKVADYRAGRVFLAGDAAHIHSPAGGQGMNTGIQDACNLAWKLALVQRGICAAEPLLESYSLERSAVGKQVLEATGRATAIALMRGEIKQSIRNHVASLIFGLAPVRKKVAEVLTELSIGYPHSPLNAESLHSPGSPAAGERAPIRPQEPPVGAGGTPLFALFAEASAAVSKFAARYPGILEPNIRKPFHEGGLWLVRPDGYTALATTNDRWDDVATYLHQIGCFGALHDQSAENAAVVKK